MISLAIEEFYPYIIRCFEAVFKPSSVTVVFGRPSLVSNYASHDTCSLDVDRITEPLSEYLPETLPVDQGVEIDITAKKDDKIEKNDSNIDKSGFVKDSINDSASKLIHNISNTSIGEVNQKQRLETSQVVDLEQKNEEALHIIESNISNSLK